MTIDPSDNPAKAESQGAIRLSQGAGETVLLLLLAGVLFFIRLGSLPLMEPDEGRNAEVAREMLVTHDWITPHFNTLTYLDKPAVFFWMVAGSFRVFGVSEWAARLPSVLMGIGCVLLIAFLARRMFGGSTGLLAGLAFATSPLAFIFARWVIFDMTLAFLATVSMVAYWLAEECDFKRARYDVLMFAGLGVATITKGPVGFLLPLLSLLAYQALRGRWRDLKRLRWLLGIVVFLAVALPWFLTVSIRNPGFPHYALWEESLQRFASNRIHRGGGIFYYLPVFLGGFFPWSLFILFFGLANLGKWRQIREDVNRPYAFLLAWIGVVFVFFSISHSKLPGYFLPAVVPLSILTARAWERIAAVPDGVAPSWMRGGFWALMGLGLVVGLMPQILHAGSLQARFEHKVPPNIWVGVPSVVLTTGVIVLLMGILGRNFASRMRGRTLILATFALVAAIFPMIVVKWRHTIQAYFATSSSQRLAEELSHSPERDDLIYGFYYYRTSLPFYLRRPVGLLTTDADELTSNYIVSQWAKYRAGGKPSAGSAAVGKATWAALKELQTKNCWSIMRRLKEPWALPPRPFW